MAVPERDYDAELRTLNNTFRFEAVGAVECTAGLIRTLIEQIAACRGVDLDAEVTAPPAPEPAPAPVLINAASPSGAANAVQPGYLQPQGAEVANSSTVADNRMTGREFIAPDYEQQYRPAITNPRDQFASGNYVQPQIDYNQLAEALGRVLGNTETAPREVIEHHNAKPSPEAEQLPPVTVAPLDTDKASAIDRSDFNR